MIMQIETTRFGALTVDESRIITFPDGLPGFEGSHRFTFVPHHAPHGDKNSLFQWMQSVEDGDLAFLTMEPHQAFPDYAPRIPRPELEALSLDDPAFMPRLYTLLTVPKGDPCGITANLMAPVIVNPRARIARQVIVNGDQYGLRHRLLPGEAV